MEVPEQSLSVDLVVDSEWETGYCASVIVVNEGEEDVAWLFSIPVEGEITQIWNALMSPNGVETLFQGVDWNMNLAPGASADFGFCAAL
jgi:endoglucanase